MKYGMKFGGCASGAVEETDTRSQVLSGQKEQVPTPRERVWAQEALAVTEGRGYMVWRLEAMVGVPVGRTLEVCAGPRWGREVRNGQEPVTGMQRGGPQCSPSRQGLHAPGRGRQHHSDAPPGVWARGLCLPTHHRGVHLWPIMAFATREPGTGAH